MEAPLEMDVGGYEDEIEPRLKNRKRENDRVGGDGERRMEDVLNGNGRQEIGRILERGWGE